MPRFQVVEKDGFGTDWSLVRYASRDMGRFATKEEALDAARQYLTDINCNNALAKAEKRNAVEAFMLTQEGCYLGVLDGDDWFMLDRYGKTVNEKYYELEGKTQVAVRQVPGS